MQHSHLLVAMSDALGLESSNWALARGRLSIHGNVTGCHHRSASNKLLLGNWLFVQSCIVLWCNVAASISFTPITPPGSIGFQKISGAGYQRVSGDDEKSEKIENRHGGMKVLVKRPANGTEAEPWTYDGAIPRRFGLVSVCFLGG
jgi:hypothetical protein